MLIVHVTSTDPAGSVINFVNATNAHTKHRARAITTMHIPEFQFRADTGVPHLVADYGEEVHELLEKADVIHLHKIKEDFEWEYKFPKMAAKSGVGQTRKFVVSDYLRKRPRKVIYHVHGHPEERSNVKDRAAEYAKRGALVLTSTPDLAAMYGAFYDRVKFFPNCVPQNDVLYLPRESDAPLQMANGQTYWCVAQSPTHTILKDVHLIKKVVAELGAKLPLFYLQIWQVEHEMALRHKRNAHVVFDHMQGYYGLSSLEGLSMGKPVIAGLSQTTMEAIMDFWGISAAALPWQIARDEDGLRNRVSDLITMDHWRRDLGGRSRKFMEETWSDKNVAQRLAAVYESL